MQWLLLLLIALSGSYLLLKNFIIVFSSHWVLKQPSFQPDLLNHLKINEQQTTNQDQNNKAHFLCICWPTPWLERSHRAAETDRERTEKAWRASARHLLFLRLTQSIFKNVLVLFLFKFLIWKEVIKKEKQESWQGKKGNGRGDSLKRERRVLKKCVPKNP